MANAGFRIYTEFTRPSKALIALFRNLPVPNIADEMHRMSCVHTRIKAVNNKKLLGCALTVKAPAGDNLMFHKALDLARPGDVIVVDAGGSMDRSLCGELMATTALSRQIAGFLIDGCVRDIATLRTLDFAVFAIGVTPQGPYKNGPGEINIPVCCGGQVIAPGDIIVGDQDGVVVIKPGDAADVAAKARAHHALELQTFESIHNCTYNMGWTDAILHAKGCEIISGKG